jgi:hypothetical protein
MNQFLAVDLLDLTLFFFVLVTGRLGFCVSTTAFSPKPALDLERLCGLLKLSVISIFFFSLACLLFFSFHLSDPLFCLILYGFGCLHGWFWLCCHHIFDTITDFLVANHYLPRRVPANLDMVSRVSKSSDLKVVNYPALFLPEIFFSTISTIVTIANEFQPGLFKPYRFRVP